MTLLTNATRAQIDSELAKRDVDVAAESQKMVEILNAHIATGVELVKGEGLVPLTGVEPLGVTLAPDEIDAVWVRITIPASTATGMDRAFKLGAIQLMLKTGAKDTEDPDTVRCSMSNAKTHLNMINALVSDKIEAALP